jgi:hypothetical protein
MWVYSGDDKIVVKGYKYPFPIYCNGDDYLRI